MQERVEQATAICARPQVDKLKERRRLEREIEAIERALKQQAKEHGATLEEIVQDLEEKKKKAHEAVKSTNEIAGLVKVSALDGVFLNLFSAPPLFAPPPLPPLCRSEY